MLNYRITKEKNDTMKLDIGLCMKSLDSYVYDVTDNIPVFWGNIIECECFLHNHNQILNDGFCSP